MYTIWCWSFDVCLCFIGLWSEFTFHRKCRFHYEAVRSGCFRIDAKHSKFIKNNRIHHESLAIAWNTNKKSFPILFYPDHCSKFEEAHFPFRTKVVLGVSRVSRPHTMFIIGVVIPGYIRWIGCNTTVLPTFRRLSRKHQGKREKSFGCHMIFYLTL